MYVCMKACVCVCVRERERERERESMHVCMHECMPKCVCVSPATGLCVHTMFLCDYHGIICTRQSPESASPPTMRIVCKSQSPESASPPGRACMHARPLAQRCLPHTPVHTCICIYGMPRVPAITHACRTLLCIHAYVCVHAYACPCMFVDEHVH